MIFTGSQNISLIEKNDGTNSSKVAARSLLHQIGTLSDVINNVTNMSWLPFVAFLLIQQNHVTFILLITWAPVQTGSRSDVMSGHQFTRPQRFTICPINPSKQHLKQKVNILSGVQIIRKIMFYPVRKHNLILDSLNVYVKLHHSGTNNSMIYGTFGQF